MAGFRAYSHTVLIFLIVVLLALLEERNSGQAYPLTSEENDIDQINGIRDRHEPCPLTALMARIRNMRKRDQQQASSKQQRPQLRLGKRLIAIFPKTLYVPYPDDSDR